MTKKVPMTPRGEQLLRTELQALKTVTRPNIIAAIAEAREHGDLKENAEYHAAREQQAFCEDRINYIEGRLSLAQIIDIKRISPTGKVIFGSTITIINLQTDARISYQIVGEDEADIKVGLISVTSPIGKTMIGKEEGDEVEVQTPGGILQYEIVQVQHLELMMRG
jgi:transcription elongation factor GreA